MFCIPERRFYILQGDALTGIGSPPTSPAFRPDVPKASEGPDAVSPAFCLTNYLLYTRYRVYGRGRATLCKGWL